MNNASFKAVLSRFRQSAIVFAGVGTAIRLGANILLLPLILSALSQDEQALWWVFVALGNFAFLADLGFGAAIVRVYNFFWAGADDFETEGLKPVTQTEPNYGKIRQLHSTVRHLFNRLCCGAIAILAVVGSFLLYRPIQGSESAGQLWVIWALYLLAIWFNVWSTQWSLALQGINRLRDVHMAYVGSSLGYVLVAGLLLLGNCGLLSMVVATAVRALVQKEIARRAFDLCMQGKGVASLQPDFSIVRRLWPNARKFAILGIGSYFIGNSGVLISRYFLDSAATASLGLTAQIGGFLMGFATLWISVKWPQITILRAQGQTREMGILFFRRLRLVLLTFIFLAVIVLLHGNRILEWKGSETKLLASPYLWLFFSYLGLQLFYTQFGTLVFTENVVPFFNISIVTGICVVLLSAIFTKFFGLWGLLLAPLLVEWSCSAWFTVRRGFRSQPLKLNEAIRVAFKIP